MGGGVDAAGLEIKADGFGDLCVEPLLGGDRIRAGRQGGGAGGGFFHGFGGGFAECRAHGIEERGDGGGGGAAFVAFEQGVVGFAGVAPEIGFLAGDAEQRFEVRGEGGEIRALAGLGPGVFGERGGGGFAGDELDGELGGAVEFAAEFAQVGGEFRIGAGVGGLGGFERGFPGVRCGEFVGAGREPGELGGAVIRGRRTAGRFPDPNR